MRGTRPLFTGPTGLALAAFVAAAAFRVESGPAPNPNADYAERPVLSPGRDQGPVSGSDQPAPPKPAAAHRKELPAAFTKAVPTSVADLRAIEQHVKELVVRVSPVVVAVEVGYGNGSGVVITADGLVLTAGHVAERPNREVRFTFRNGKTARGKTLGNDRDSDTGLMRITDPGPWPFVATGELADVTPGDWVLALGHPGGFDSKRSLVVRLGRMIRLGSDILQTDCPISPGDSGGPLFDMHGHVIGIHSAISSSLAQNYHVPIGEFYENWAELAKAERPSSRPAQSRWHSYLGAHGVDDAQGCRIRAIDQDSPAFQAGLEVGDVVLEIEGREIKTAAALRRWVAESQPGETLHLEIRRGEQPLSVAVKLASEAQHD